MRDDVRGDRAVVFSCEKGRMSPETPGRRALLLLISGHTTTFARIVADYRDVLGCLTTPAAGNTVARCLRSGLPWAIDNGAFSGFDRAAFMRLCERAYGLPGCLFVVAPDVVGDARATLDAFPFWGGVIRNLCRQPVALAGQDGAEDLDIPWNDFACWFIGGSTRWKLSQASADLAAEAKRRGKWVHMGRVNSFRRLQAAYDMGCDSVDGTGMSRWGDRHLAKFCQWVRRLGAQPVLF